MSNDDVTAGILYIMGYIGNHMTDYSKVYVTHVLPDLWGDINITVMVLMLLICMLHFDTRQKSGVICQF